MHNTFRYRIEQGRIPPLEVFTKILIGEHVSIGVETLRICFPKLGSSFWYQILCNPGRHVWVIMGQAKNGRRRQLRSFSSVVELCGWWSVWLILRIKAVSYQDHESY